MTTLSFKNMLTEYTFNKGYIKGILEANNYIDSTGQIARELKRFEENLNANCQTINEELIDKNTGNSKSALIFSFFNIVKYGLKSSSEIFFIYEVLGSTELSPSEKLALSSMIIGGIQLALFKNHRREVIANCKEKIDNFLDIIDMNKYDI